MILEINVDDDLVDVLQKATVYRFGRQEMIPNPEPAPKPISSKSGEVKNQKEIDEYKTEIPNPASLDDLIREKVIDELRIWVRDYKIDLVRSKKDKDLELIN